MITKKPMVIKMITKSFIVNSILSFSGVIPKGTLQLLNRSGWLACHSDKNYTDIDYDIFADEDLGITISVILTIDWGCNEFHINFGSNDGSGFGTLIELGFHDLDESLSGVVDAAIKKEPRGDFSKLCNSNDNLKDGLQEGINKLYEIWINHSESFAYSGKLPDTFNK
ncbi:MAG: hypothetical protein ACJAS1_000562 [Oleiphilaceae bacterium]|jgi:hypothetical protein